MIETNRRQRRSIQRRLFLILAVASALVTIASSLAIFAMSRIRSEFESVSARELPETTSALRLAQIAERLQGRGPALIAADNAAQRLAQKQLIDADLAALGAEIDRLKAAESREVDVIDAIAANAQALHQNLNAIGDLLAMRADLVRRSKEATVWTLAQQNAIRQILGPSILAINDAVNRGLPSLEPVLPDKLASGKLASGKLAPDEVAADKRAARTTPTAANATFIAAVAMQAPLREAERLGDAAVNSLLVAVEARDQGELEASRDHFRRIVDEWADLIPTVPAGLRQPLRLATAGFAKQIAQPENIFDVRRDELQTLAQADELTAANRQLADQLSQQVDRLVASANAMVSRAERAIDTTIVRHSLLLVGLSIAAIATAVLISYLFVIRDLGAGLRSITSAMTRLAGGEHDVTVPATDRGDEIGDLARAFAVFHANARRMVTLDQQLVEKSNLLVATFDNMNDGFSVHDAESRLMAWNAQYVRIYDLPQEILVPGTRIEAIHRLIAGRGSVFRNAAGVVVNPRDLSAERQLRAQHFEVNLANGRTVELRSNPIPSGGFVTIHIDVTERKVIEVQLRQAQKMEVVGQLTGGLAHDFNNLLAVIQGNLHLLEEYLQDQPMLRERAARALAAGDRAAMQIERLLAFARRQKLRPQMVDVKILLTSIMDLLDYSLGADVVMQADLADGLPPVRVDPGQLENAILNLALNARDAMDGMGSLTIAARPLTVTDPLAETAVEISVRDNGRGMPPDVIEHAIEPFFTTKARGKGSGLGLSMVYGFVRQSGGTFRIESIPGSGTTIIFTLPVADSPAEAAAAFAGDAGGDWDAEAVTILVTEDDPILRDTVAGQLRRLGYRVREAADAAAAIELLRGDPAICLLYTDIILGAGADGFTLAREAQALRSSLRVLYTSAEVSVAVGATSDVPGDRTILRKPVHPDVLAAALAASLRRSPGAQSSSTTVSKT